MGVGEGNRFAYDCILDAVPKGILQPVFDERYGQMGDVDADPMTLEALGDGDSCTAPTEGVEDQLPFAATGFDDAFQKGLGLLGRIAQAFLRHGG